MPALNFQKQFADAVERGEKCQTIRKRRKDGRDPKPGDTLYLYTGMRTKACRKLGEVRCAQVMNVRVSRKLVKAYRTESASLMWAGTKADEFAQSDGFADHAEMANWFERTHGLPFEGLLIRWERAADAEQEGA